jgi:hypothetical protein
MMAERDENSSKRHDPRMLTEAQRRVIPNSLFNKVLINFGHDVTVTVKGYLF